MRTFLRRAAVTATCLGALGGAVVGTAAPAMAASCNTTTKSIDDRGYTGPWPDNWTMKATMCSYRSGSYIYSYAKLSWDRPASYGNAPHLIFDAAKFRVALKKSISGATDPVRYRRDFGIEGRLEDGDGSYTTPTIRHAISRYALGDGAWKLNWNNDGDGYKTYRVTASPRV
ncbi:hypothetical protein [Streptomyces sp. AC602_WCS936]|uniref:hypothetical protein n=1 Tax=Streptomyces sp. AC602_WCS936 TaxID=2823685 RepID=UPI001C27A6A5|nr:hypothetical protein [Streptomyces sp. AC602_WCS936]